LGFFSKFIQNRLVWRGTLFVLAWLIVISSLWLPYIGPKDPLGLWAGSLPGASRIPIDVLHLIFTPPIETIQKQNEARYVCGILFLVSQCIADFYFALTVFIIAIPASLRFWWIPVGKIVRCSSLILLFIWFCPMATYLYPSRSDNPDEWKWGFYWMAFGYTLMTLAILYTPRIPGADPTIPIAHDPLTSIK
jgi:hypothetical protein